MKKYKLPLPDGSEIIFRAISADEADKMNSALQKESPDIEESIFNSLTENRYNLKEIEAGTVLIVIACALKVSGTFNKLSELPDLIVAAREAINKNIYMLLYKVIIQAQPSYNLSQLKTFSLNELLEEVAFSEAIMGKSAIDTEKMKEALSTPAPGTAAVKKGIKSVTPEELKAVTDYFSEMGPNGEFADADF